MTPEQQQQDTERRMRDICHAIKERLPEDWGFIVMVTPFEKAIKKGHEARLNYASNMERKQAINVLKEWLIKAGAAEDWMKRLN